MKTCRVRWDALNKKKKFKQKSETIRNDPKMCDVCTFVPVSLLFFSEGSLTLPISRDAVALKGHLGILTQSCLT